MLLFTSHCDGGFRDYVLRFGRVNFAVCYGGLESHVPICYRLRSASKKKTGNGAGVS